MATPVCRGVWFGLLTEKLLKKPLRPFQTFLREDHRFRLAARIGDMALLVQTMHGFPIEALPDSSSIVQPEAQQSKHGIVDLVRVEFHRSRRFEARAIKD